MNILKAFQKKQTQSNKTYNPIVPSGLIAHTEKGYFYIKGVKRFKFVSEKAMLSWDLPVIITTESKMAGFGITGVLGFRDGSLVQNIADGKIYLISDSKRRHITNPDVIEWVSKEVLKVSEKDISTHVEGDTLDA
jgi:hypothetical protein